MKKLATVITLLVLACYSRESFALDLGIPIACVYGEDCFIESYYDHNDKPEEYADHTCGRLSEDGHSSTDFKLRNHTQMKEGVNVVAGDSGEIFAVRDGMSDISVNLIGEEAVRGRECGNGVIIDHKRGYRTQYCHLKQNSILVKKGDRVEKGQPIGQVGLSGISSFPYLEFTVTLKGKPIDPFTGENPVNSEENIACDSLDVYPLWDKLTEKRLQYISTALLSMGFSEKVPHAQGAREGKFGRKEIKDTARLLVFWVDIFGVVQGDDLKMTIIDPNGEIIKTETRPFTNNRRHIFQFLGKKPDSEHWTLGEYVGKIELMRKDGEESETVINDSTSVEIIKDMEEEELVGN